MYPNLQHEFPFPPARRVPTQENRCLDVVGFLIGLYHFVYSGCMALKEWRAWYDTGAAMQRNSIAYTPDIRFTFIYPHAYKISTSIVYSSLGLVLLYAIFQKSVNLVLRWLIWIGTLDILVCIYTEMYRQSLFSIMWELIKSACQLSIIWSLVEEMRKEVAAEERRDNVRQAIAEERRQPLRAHPLRELMMASASARCPRPREVLPVTIQLPRNPNQQVQLVPHPFIVNRSIGNAATARRMEAATAATRAMARARVLRRFIGQNRLRRQELQARLPNENHLHSLHFP